MKLYPYPTRGWLLLLGIVAFIMVCTALTWRVAATNPSLSAELYIALGSALIVVSAVSLGAIMRAHYSSRAAFMPLILGPVVGCAAGGMGSVALVVWPDSWAALYLFAVAIVSFQAASILAVLVRRRSSPSQRSGQASER